MNSKSVKLVIIILLTIIMTIYIFGYVYGDGILSWMLSLSILSDIFCVLLIKKYNKFFSFSFIYFSYLFLSHVGVFYLNLVGFDLNKHFTAGSLNWLMTQYYEDAKLISSIAFIAYLIANIYFNNRKISFNHKNKLVYNTGVISIFGLILLTIAVVYNVYIFVILLTSYGLNYRVFREVSQNFLFYSWSLFLFATGYSFAVSSENKSVRKNANIIFLIGAVVLLITGNRGEVLFPLAAVLPIIAWNKKIKFGKLSFGLIGLLLLMNFIFLNRSSDELVTSLSIVSPIAEIGFTMRPLENLLSYMDREILDYGYGATYLIPTFNVVIRFLTGGLMSLNITSTQHYLKPLFPKQGFSVIAEAYYNFGYIGVIIVMFIISYILVKFSNPLYKQEDLAVKGAIVAVLINNVRNFSYFIPGQLIIIFLLAKLSTIVRKKDKTKEQSDVNEASSLEGGY